MRLVPVLFPCDLGRSDRGSYVAGGERGAPDVVLDALEGEGVRFARPRTVPVEIPEVADAEDAILKFDGPLTRAVTSLAQVVSEVNADADFPLILGGDHTALLGHALGHSERHGQGFGVAVLADAFLDLEAPAKPVFDDKAALAKDAEVTSTGNAHRMVLSGVLRRMSTETELGRTMEASAAQAAHTSIAGVRGRRTAQVRTLARKTNVEVFDMERLELDGESSYRSLLTRHLSAGPILLSIDCTGLDPDMMTATRDSHPDGLDWAFLKRTLEQCIPHIPRILGLDITELDHTQDDAHQGGLTRFAETVGPFLRRLTK